MNKRPVDLAAAVAVTTAVFVPRAGLIAEVLESPADKLLPPCHGGDIVFVDLVDLVVAVVEAFNRTSFILQIEIKVERDNYPITPNMT